VVCPGKNKNICGISSARQLLMSPSVLLAEVAFAAWDLRKGTYDFAIPKLLLENPHNRLTTTSFLMSSSSLLRIAARAQPSTFFRANGLRSLTPHSSNALYAVPALIATSGSVSSFSTSSVRLSDKDGQEASHHEESFEEFTARYVDPQLGVESF
jgi:hypothetical protein